MTNWNNLYILDITTNKKMWNSFVSDAALPGAIRELERHFNNIQSGAKYYEGFNSNVVMIVNDNVHRMACIDDLLAELMC